MKTKTKGTNKIIPIVLSIVLIAAVVFSVWFYFSTQLPPGCIDSPFIGGCFSTNKIKDLHVSGVLPSCIKISVNNCTCPSLEIENTCTYDPYFFLEGEKISGMYSYPKFTLDSNNKPVYLQEGETCTAIPKTDQQYVLSGMVNRNLIQISYTLTAAWCD